MNVNKSLPLLPIHFLWTISLQMLHLDGQFFAVSLLHPLLLHFLEMLNVFCPIRACLRVVSLRFCLVKHFYSNLHLPPLQLLVETVSSLGVRKARNHLLLVEVYVARVSEMLEVLGSMVFRFHLHIGQPEDRVRFKAFAQLLLWAGRGEQGGQGSYFASDGLGFFFVCLPLLFGKDAQLRESSRHWDVISAITIGQFFRHAVVKERNSVRGHLTTGELYKREAFVFVFAGASLLTPPLELGDRYVLNLTRSTENLRELSVGQMGWEILDIYCRSVHFLVSEIVSGGEGHPSLDVGLCFAEFEHLGHRDGLLEEG